MRNSFMKIVVQYESYLSNGHALMLLLFTPRFHYALNVRSQALLRALETSDFIMEMLLKSNDFASF